MQINIYLFMYLFIYLIFIDNNNLNCLGPQVASANVRRPPQWSNTAHVLNLTRLADGKLLGNSKSCCKTSKDKAVTGKRSFKR